MTVQALFASIVCFTQEKAVLLNKDVDHNFVP